jgi:predicted RND superfamily exporter protein
MVSYGGTYIIALDDSNLIMQDMLRNGFLSFFFIICLYYFCYRRFGALLYSTLPLIVGQCLTLGVAYIFLRSLNSATTGFTAMLMGLGTDFTIVMYARYVEERRRGKSLEEALRLMMGVSAFGVFTGAITSAGTFYAMCVTEYKGLWDFGFLVGSGILLCLVAILFLLPALITFNEARRPDVAKKLYLHSFGIEGVMTWSTRHPWPVLVASAVLTVVAGYFAWNVQFSDSVKDLRSAANRGVIMQETIASKFNSAINPMMVLCRADDVPTLMERNRQANGLLDGFVEDGTLLSYDSIFSYLPPRQEQDKVIQALNDGANDAFNIERIERTFRAALRAQGFREGFYDPFLQALPATLRPERPVSLADLREAGLERFIDRYVRQDDDGRYTSVTYLFPADASAKRHAPPQLVRALDRPGEGMELTGVNLASTELRRIFKHDARLAVIVGLLVVGILLWLDFRSLWLTALANIQLLTGVIWMLAMMSILNIKMNFVNAFVATMILGVGIDYGIHIIHRISQEGLSNPSGLLETGKAVIMAALTNVAGFGTLALSNYPGLRSMGIVSAIGSVTCLITALTLLPALMILTRTRIEPREP